MITVVLDTHSLLQEDTQYIYSIQYKKLSPDSQLSHRTRINFRLGKFKYHLTRVNIVQISFTCHYAMSFIHDCIANFSSDDFQGLSDTQHLCQPGSWEVCSHCQVVSRWKMDCKNEFPSVISVKRNTINHSLMHHVATWELNKHRFRVTSSTTHICKITSRWQVFL